VVDQQVLLGLKVQPVLQELRVHRDPLVPLVYKELRDQRGLQGFKAPLDPQALVLLAPQVHRALQVFKVLLVFQALLACRVPLDPQVLALLVPQVFKVPLELKV
jgi:hypothetical protein